MNATPDGCTSERLADSELWVPPVGTIGDSDARSLNIPRIYLDIHASLSECRWSKLKPFRVLSIENEVYPPTWDIVGMFAFTLR